MPSQRSSFRTSISPGLAVFIILAVGLVALNGTAEARSPVQIEIHLAKNHFALTEQVTGSVIITSSIPATFPMNFTVYLYRDGEFYRRSVVNTPVFMGTNEVPLESFGMKDIFTGPHAAARWRIEIHGGGDDPVTATAEFSILRD